MTRMIMIIVKSRANDFSRIIQKILLNHNDLRHQRSIRFQNNTLLITPAFWQVPIYALTQYCFRDVDK